MYDIQAVSVNVKYGEYTIEDSNVIIAVFTSSVYSKNKQIRKSVLSEIRKKYPQKLPVVFITLNFEDVEVEFLDKKMKKNQLKKFL